MRHSAIITFLLISCTYSVNAKTRVQKKTGLHDSGEKLSSSHVGFNHYNRQNDNLTTNSTNVTKSTSDSALGNVSFSSPIQTKARINEEEKHSELRNSATASDKKQEIHTEAQPNDQLPNAEHVVSSASPQCSTQFNLTKKDMTFGIITPPLQHRAVLLLSLSFDLCFISSGNASMVFHGNKKGKDIEIILPKLEAQIEQNISKNVSHLPSLEEEQIQNGLIPVSNTSSSSNSATTPSRAPITTAGTSDTPLQALSHMNHTLLNGPVCSCFHGTISSDAIIVWSTQSITSHHSGGPVKSSNSQQNLQRRSAIASYKLDDSSFLQRHVQTQQFLVSLQASRGAYWWLCSRVPDWSQQALQVRQVNAL